MYNSDSLSVSTSPLPKGFYNQGASPMLLSMKNGASPLPKVLEK